MVHFSMLSVLYIVPERPKKIEMINRSFIGDCSCTFWTESCLTITLVTETSSMTMDLHLPLDEAERPQIWSLSGTTRKAYI